MIEVILPDGAKRQLVSGSTGTALATDISKSLAKKAIAIKQNGKLVDLALELTDGAAVEVITIDSPEALELLRHDCAHVLAEAVQELFPGTQVTIGPAIENGFYYDFAREQPFTPDDLEIIQKRMKEIIDRNEPFIREEWDRQEAIKFFESKGEAYKAELIRDLPESETISIYRQGEWLDLCRGPHMPSTGRVGAAFKLMSVAGAYWRGDHRNAMLQRIYGTVWRSEKELAAHLTMLEEAEKRDHRRLGREMDLFHLQEEAAGSIFWHAKGWTLYRQIVAYMRHRLEGAGYFEVKTPQLVDRALWEASGHWDKFRENMFTAETEDERILALKPMNCPCHVQIFRQGLKSYRELPMRMAEFGSCHRNEPSGSLHGIMRVRAFTQDDAHIFATENQITSECREFCNLLLSIYEDFGFTEVRVKFSDRPDVRAGEDSVWDKAETALMDAVNASGLEFELNPGEGAFYGPKLEFVLRDAIGRDWQCGTFQVDFVLPERLGATYVGEDSQRHTPVMLHRAILGSFERFIGILIENYAGRLPIWLAPVQVTVATIVSDADQYAREVFNRLKAAGIRAEIDLRNEKINYKVREHSLAKTPIMLVVGRREAEEGTVAVRKLGVKEQETLAVADAISRLQIEAKMPMGL
ncbi:MAG: threonine--tRNA ligase [Rhodospirillales bacterium]